MKQLIATVVIAISLIVGTVTLIPKFAHAQSVSAQAITEKTTTFMVDKMFCAACPITVKAAMAGVEGVKNVEIDFSAKTATVIFDPSIASEEEIAAASTNAGYPAQPSS